MAVKVKGVEVRSEELSLEVNFQDLTQEGQERIFLENKEKFVKDALQSKYSYIQRLLWEVDVKETCSSDTLNVAIEECIYQKASSGYILALLNVPGLQVNDKVRELLAVSTELQLKLWVAEDKNTSLELLKTDKLFMCATLDLVQSRKPVLFDAIFKNPNFKWDEEIEQKMEMFSAEGRKIIKERIESLEKTD